MIADNTSRIERNVVVKPIQRYFAQYLQYIYNCHFYLCM